ncbi:MAG: potassium transporter TrkG [Waddliaceae bacterium]
MYYREISKVLGYYLFGIALVLLIPFGLAAYFQFISDPLLHPQPHTTIDFIYTIALALGMGSLFYFFGRSAGGHLYRREGITIVVAIWVLTPLIAAVPFYTSGTLENPFIALFEATSGFSTTGATTLQAKKFDPTGQEVPYEIEFCGVSPVHYSYYGTISPVRDQDGNILFEGMDAVSRALLFWRGMTQWFGGMGIVVLFVAILPALGVGGKMLFRSEVPGPLQESLTPRIKETALRLWKIYVGLSLLEVVILLWTDGEMSLFQAVTITFTNASTGGFTPVNGSIGYFANPMTEWVIMTFMFLGGVNYALYFYALQGKFYRFFEPEFFLYIILLLLGGGFASWFIIGRTKVLTTGMTEGVYSVPEAIRYGFFQVVSVMTTTGYTTVDYDRWPYAVQVLLLILMYVGGMSGSTSGGFKVIRHYMLFRIGQNHAETLFQPETVQTFRIGNREVDKRAITTVLNFFLIAIAVAVFSTFIFCIDGVDPETSLSLSSLFVNNIGIGFRMASPMHSCAFLSDFSLIFSCFLMILGRLEFLVVLAILVPNFWRNL